MRAAREGLAAVLSAFLLAPACAGPDARIDPEKLSRALRGAPAPKQDWHVGPEVALGADGPARFVKTVAQAFEQARAMTLVRFIDGYYRAAANEGYEAVLERIEKELREAGYGSGDARLELQWLQSEGTVKAWTPRSARLELLAPPAPPEILLQFSAPADAARVMLPVHAPAAAIEGRLVCDRARIRPGAGDVLATEEPAADVQDLARELGLAGVLSASLASYNTDPTGQGRERDALQFQVLPEDQRIPVFQISRRLLERLRGIAEAEPRVRMQAAVEVAERPLRHLVATIRGAQTPSEAVLIAAHVQEPGANDNASGAAGMAEGARALAELLRAGKLAWPARSLAFVWGEEIEQSRVWLARSGRTALAAISADMLGESYARTGAIALLERGPDPGALDCLPPDRHTPWGQAAVHAEDLRPNGLAVVARCALVDVGLLAGTWRCADHPYEGGSDHSVFWERGIPAVLYWHFTDYTYHTSLDRLAQVDAAELERTAVAVLATGLALVNPRPTDLERYLKSLQLEERMRCEAAQSANLPESAKAWTDWSLGARHWLRGLCLRLADGDAYPASRPTKPSDPPRSGC